MKHRELPSEERTTAGVVGRQLGGPAGAGDGWGKRRPPRSAARRERGGAGGREANARRAERGARGAAAPDRANEMPGTNEMDAGRRRGEHARPEALPTHEVAGGTGRWNVRPRGSESA
jgi:hypothetical protein